jgi:hypothetical protein
VTCTRVQGPTQGTVDWRTVRILAKTPAHFKPVARHFCIRVEICMMQPVGFTAARDLPPHTKPALETSRAPFLAADW